MRDNYFNFPRKTTRFNKNSFLYPLLILLFTVIGRLAAQDSLNVTWVNTCLGSVSYRVSTGVNNGATYLFNYQQGSVLMMNINDPVHPQRLCEIGNPGETGKGILVDSLYYQAVGSYGLFIYNLTDPSRPVRIGSCPLGEASSVAVAGQYAYVVSRDSGLVVVDIADPVAPVKVGSLNLGVDGGVDVAVSDTVAYISCYFKLAIVNIRDPVHPALIGWWHSSYPYDFIRSVAKQGNFIYLADFDCGVWVVDVSDPAHPVAAGSLSCGLVLDLAVSGTHIYAALEDRGLGVIDCTDPQGMFVVSILAMPDCAEGVCVRGDIVYVADLYSTRVVNVSDPVHPYEEYYYDNLQGWPIEVALAGHYAYVAYRFSGLQIVDISEPAFPKPIGSYNTPGEARGVTVQDSFAYVADADSGLIIVNIRNPQRPFEIGHWNGSTQSSLFINSVVVSGNYAYLAGYPGIIILDISNPQYPISIFEYPYYCEYIMKDGDYIYSGNAIINVADPYHPYQIGTCGGLGDCAVKDNYLYKLGQVRMPIYDISDKSSPIKVDSLEIIGQGLTIEGDNLYTGENDYYGGDGYQLHVVRIADPLHPEIIGYYAKIRNAGGDPSYRLKVSGEYIYVPTNAGFQIYRFTGLPAVQETGGIKTVGNPVRIIPNPFREQTKITINPWSIPGLVPKNQPAVGPIPLSLKIYDTAGRLVKTFTIQESRSTSVISFQWDGRSENGYQQPAGVYLYRLTMAGHSWTGKIVNVR